MTGRFKLLVSEAWRSLGANLSTTVAATMTVLIGMFLLGLFIALGTWTVSWSNHVKSELLVKVSFADSATSTQKGQYARLVSQSPYVKENGVRYIPKAQGLREMQKRYPEITQGLTSNPIPDQLRITPNKAENLDKLFASLTGANKPAYVEKVTDGKRISHRILQVAHVIEVVFTLATLVLVIASILLISNTIRLSIFSRRREIEGMKLVGATNWFVRGPFMLEGLICGLAGSLAAVLLLVIGKAALLPSIGIGHSKDAHAMAFELNALIIIGIGLTLGLFGTGITLRRFLQV